MLATAGSNGTVRLSDVGGAGASLPTLVRVRRFGVDSVAFSRHGSMLAAGYDDGEVAAWDLQGQSSAGAEGPGRGFAFRQAPR